MTRLGPKFDGLVVDAIKRGEPGRILAIDPALARKAGECGWKPAVFALGALDGHGIDSRFISYEGPFGVGYMTALLTPPRSGLGEQAEPSDPGRGRPRCHCRGRERTPLCALPGRRSSGMCAFANGAALGGHEGRRQ